jgi:hypothetical protein
MRKSHLDLVPLAAYCWKASVLANERTRSRTSSLRSRVILCTTAVVHLGFNEHCEQSLLLGHGRPFGRSLSFATQRFSSMLGVFALSNLFPPVRLGWSAWRSGVSAEIKHLKIGRNEWVNVPFLPPPWPELPAF